MRIDGDEDKKEFEGILMEFQWSFWEKMKVDDGGGGAAAKGLWLAEGEYCLKCEGVWGWSFIYRKRLVLEVN